MSRFSCVVDEQPRFHLDALRWFAALTEVAGVDPTDLVVHVVGPDTSDVLSYLRTQGVSVHPVDRFDPRSPHCNKISGALRLADERVEGMIALCDSDLAILEDPRQLVIPPRAIAGKPVDAPVPPLDVLIDVFRSAGVELPATVSLPWGPDQWTLSGNNNGGLYLMPGPLLEVIATAWAHWARWLLERMELLAEWRIYVDQVAMALGLAAEGIGSVPLDVRWNTPVHDMTRIPPDAPEPAAIHYHQEVDQGGLLRLTGTPSIDGRIAVVNGAIAAVWRRALPEVTHRRWLSVSEPASAERDGPDERRTILSVVLEALQPVSVLDVGCGAGAATAGLPIMGYRGISTSAEVVRVAEDAWPDAEYVVGTLTDYRTEADLTICFDLLTQQSDAAAYRDLVRQLWHSARRGLVASGLEGPSSSGDPSVRFHEPLSVTLQHVAPDAEIYPVSSAGPVTTFVVLKPPMEQHPRDFLPTTLASLAARHPDLLSLLALRLDARRTTGFYPDHAPRLWEYPVVADLISDLLPPGSRLVDVGAGVTPLAPFLNSRGYVVDTVDPSPTRRTWPPQSDWNEWDFLDYGSVGLAHRSWNCTLGELPFRPVFDGAYSISVIEHVPAQERRALLADISARVRTGGLVVLTIDLVRGNDDLWNRNRGLQVEDPLLHGTIQDIIAEGAAVGLELFRHETVRDWGDVDVDIGLLAMHQTGRPHERGLRDLDHWIRSKVGRTRR